MPPRSPTSARSTPHEAASAAPISVAIALVVHNQARLTLRALVALAGLEHGATFETVLVDDGSDDATPAVIAGVEGDFVGLREPERRGLAAGYDVAIAACSTDAIVLMSEEVIPTAGWLAAALAPFSDPAVGAVRPRAIDIGGRDVTDPSWPCLAVRRDAHRAVGGLLGTMRVAQSVKATFTGSLTDAGWGIVDAPQSLVLVIPEAASRAAGMLDF